MIKTFGGADLGPGSKFYNRRRVVGRKLKVMATSSKKVVFFFPAFSSQEATAPLGILAVATPLLRAGYQVRIIDSTITSNFQKTLLNWLSAALCAAVSLVSAPRCRETLH